MPKLKTKLESYSTALIVDIVYRLATDPRDEATTIIETAMDILERRLPAGEFVEVCESLEVLIA